jgi:transposase
MSKFIGIDISKNKFDCAFLKENKKWEQKKHDYTSEGICLFYENLPLGDRVFVMEATGPYYLKLAYFLYEKGEKVAIVNPLKIRRFAQMRFERIKTDKADARIIASYGESEELQLWEPLEEHIVDIRQICSVMERLVKDRTAWKNKQEALENDPKHSLLALKEIDEMIAYISKKLVDLEDKLDELIKDHYDDQNKIIRSIPGIGPKTAIMLLALTNGFARFDTYKEFISYVGLSPRIYDSGTIKGRARICKLGMSRARQLLYMAARSASKYNTACRLLYLRLLEKGKAKKLALIAVANKLVKQAFALTSKSEFYAKDFAL